MKLVKVTQPNCRPCLMLELYLNNNGVSYESKDITVDESVIEKFDISSTPVTLLLDDSENVVSRVNGFNPSDTSELDELISKL